MAAKRIGRSAGKKALQQLRNKQKFAANQQRAQIQKQINASNKKIQAANAKNAAAKTNWTNNAYRISLDKRNEANAAKMAEVQEALRKQQKLNKKIANNLNSVGDLASGTAPGTQTAPGGNLAPVQVENIVFDTYVFEGTPAERDKAKRTSERNQELAAKMTRSFEKIAENTKLKVDQNTDVFSDLSNSINGKHGKGGLLNQMKKWNPIKLLDDAANIFDDKFKDVGKSMWDFIIDMMTLGAWFGVVKDTFKLVTKTGTNLLKLLLVKPVKFALKILSLIPAGYKFAKGFFGFVGSGKIGKAGKKLGLLPAKAARGARRVGAALKGAWFYSMFFKENGVVKTRSTMGAVGHFLHKMRYAPIAGINGLFKMIKSGGISIFKPLYSGKAGPLKWVIRLGLPALAVYGLLRFAGVSDETITSTIKKAGTAVWDFFKDSKIVKYLMDIDWSGKAADTVNWLVELFKDPAAGAADLLTIQMPKLWEFVKNKIRGMGTWFEYELIKPLIAKMIPQTFWSDEMKADYKVGKADAKKYRNSPEGQKEFHSTNKKVLKEWETFMDNLHQKWLKNPGYWWSTDSERIWMPTVEHSRQIMDKYLGGWSYLGGGELGVHINGITRDAIVTKEATIYISRKREVLKALKEILKNRGMSDQELVKLGIKLSKRVQNEYDKQDSDLKKASDEILQQKNKDGSAYKITKNALNKVEKSIKNKAQGVYNAVANKSTHLDEWKDENKTVLPEESKAPNNVMNFEGGKGAAKKVKVKGKNSILYPNGKIKIGGHRNWRNNNPGNLEAGSFSKRNGAIGSDGRFAIWPSMKEGYAAQAKLLTKTSPYKNMTLAAAISRYAPRADGNDTTKYIRVVMKNTGIAQNRIMGTLSPKESKSLVYVMSKHEGMKPGTVKSADGTEYTEETPGGALDAVGNFVQDAIDVTSAVAGGITSSVIQTVLGANYGKIVGAIGSAFGITMTDSLANGIPRNSGEATEGMGGATGTPNMGNCKLRGKSLEGVKDEAIKKLKKLCSLVGTELYINSAYRTPAYNTKIGGTKKSYHMKGMALDIHWPNSSLISKANFLKAAVKAGFTGFGIYPNFLHVDIGPAREWGGSAYGGQVPSWASVIINNGRSGSGTNATFTMNNSSITTPPGSMYVPALGGLITNGNQHMQLMQENNKMMGAELNSIRKSVDVLNQNQKTHQDGDLVGIIPIANIQ